MLITKDTQKPVIEDSSFCNEQYIQSHRALVEHYRAYTNKDLGITKPVPVLEVLGRKPDPWLETKVAILCENFVRKSLLTETSRADLPQWIKAGLALISASAADDLSDLVISEQPLQSKSGKIHYMDIQTEKNKGRIPAGVRMFDALRGYIGTDEVSSEKVTLEPLGAAGATTYAVTLEYLPVIPGSVVLTDGNLVVRDDRNGNLVGDVGGPTPPFTNTINYITGDVSVEFSGATSAGVTADYVYNIEAAEELPKYGIGIRSVTVEARARAIATEWGQQMAIDLMNDWGVDAEPTILDAGGKIITAEKFKHIVKHLYRVASGGSMVFNNTTPTGISYQEHIDSFGIMLSRLQHEIWQNTQRVRPNVCVHSPDIWFLFQYTKGFTGDAAPGKTDALSGPKKSGTLSNHNITCIADPTFPPASAVLTYRGGDILNTAAIVGMYIPLYKAPIHARFFKKDTAMLTEYAIHVINSQMMGRVQVINL
jgi:hypothetical protein